MKLTYSNKQNYILITIKGIIRSTDVSEFKKSMKHIICLDKSIIIDLRHVDHIHFRFVKQINVIRKTLKIHGKELKIICKNPYIISIFNLVHYRFFYNIIPDIGSAKHAMVRKTFV